MLHFLSFWSFGPSFPFLLAFWVFISFHFGFLSIMVFWAFISFHFGLLSLPKRPSDQDLGQNCNFLFKFCSFSFSKICGFGPSFGFFGAGNQYLRPKLTFRGTSIGIGTIGISTVLLTSAKGFWIAYLKGLLTSNLSSSSGLVRIC